MAQQAVMAAVEQRLSALWTNCPVDTANQGGLPPAAPFLDVQYPVANEQQISIGSPGAQLFRETGAIRFVLSIQPGSGADWAVTWMDQLRALFRAKQFAATGQPTVNTWAPAPVILDDRNTVGGFWQLSFSVPYYFDFIA